VAASFKFKGASKMVRTLKDVLDRTTVDAEKALFIEGELIMTDSKRNHVPVDLGVLRSSGLVQEPERKGNQVTVRLGYGGAAAPYALAVHEHPSKTSPPSWQGKVIRFSPLGRGPKYLERPFFGALRGMDKRLAKRMKVDD